MNSDKLLKNSFSEAWNISRIPYKDVSSFTGFRSCTIDTFYNSLSYNDQDSLNSAAGGNFLYKMSTNAPPSSSTSSSSNFEFQQMAAALEDKMTLTFRNEMNEMKNMKKALVPTPVPIKAVEERGQQDFQNEQRNFQKTMMSFMQNNGNNGGNNHASTSGTLPSNNIPNPRNECKGITTRSGIVLDGPLPPMPPPYVNPDNEKAKETVVTKDQVQPARVQPPVVQIKEKVQNKEKEPIIEPRVINEPLKTKTNLPYPSRVKKDKNHERDDILASKFIEIFRDLHFVPHAQIFLNDQKVVK
ncbi:hypothetical protein Tco_1022173 [Tanacetum coccineum]